ncbi:high affinity cGMP-specific 3',5'-cyclic phosphodiesterase 9A-like isoform X3 [Synchiropus splendidus]|uniref:high affinity cGMP-specific 3',5'-cyclic phosphodiesterase 9A-like isoform X3 n=1 Tax=Synchiropus splendidus TaxID=270530 RepID=UPI00237D7343|nr:high affinity cGMP-specific 3',5'-cyclic phosphodiesterase 9A-like isoform X3 [Synchiropus splendidus]
MVTWREQSSATTAQLRKSKVPWLERRVLLTGCSAEAMSSAHEQVFCVCVCHPSCSHYEVVINLSDVFMIEWWINDHCYESDLFRAAAEAEPHHILKMFKPNGSIVKISPLLDNNTPESYYRLEVVATDLTSVSIPAELDDMELRLQHLENKLMEDAEKTPGVMCEIQAQVEKFKRKLESVEHLSWLGLFRDEVDQQRLQQKTSRLSEHEERSLVYKKFIHMSSLQVTEEVRDHLKTPVFDNWQWEESEMLVLLQVMFTDLDFLTAFHIELSVLQNFLFEMYGLIWLTDLRNKLGPMDLLIMVTAALCHDLDHPGYNNVYQINAQTDLALRYNDISPLENHHCAVAFGILSKPECNILKNLSNNQYKHFRGGMIKCILATDMARHNEILNKFKVILPVFDFNNKDHKEVLMKIMVKVSDISNEARPMAVAEPWLDCLLQEFFNQSDSEKSRGLPVTPFMDRDTVSKPSSQTNFIRFVLIPLFSELTNLFPCLEQHILEPVRRALDYYAGLEGAGGKDKTP